jgi:PAS domain S-box-containing protein
MTKMKSRSAKSKIHPADPKGEPAKLPAIEEQFRSLVECVEEYAIYMLDPEGNVTTWNSGAEKIKGYTAAEILGKNFACFYTSDDVASGKPQKNLNQARIKGHIREQGQRVRQDGSTFHADVVTTAMRDGSGNIVGFSKVTRDMTDQIRARSAEAALLAAEKAGKAKDYCLDALSHALRTPLPPALATASYLADNIARFPAEFGEEIDTIRRNVKLQARLIDDLLDLTRVARGKIELQFDRVDAHTAVRDAISIAQGDIDEKGLKLSLSLSAKAHHIWADPIRIEQVFWNLINNAVKFSAGGGKIDIRTLNDEHGHFEFQITDCGIGIEAERVRTLFRPFEQGDSSVTRQFGGLGLGLAISKHLVDLHNGLITVGSRGRSYGATFTVILDTVPDQVGRSGVPARLPHRPSKPLRILLVEDHVDTRRTLCRLLRHFGHEISEADCSQRALEIVRAKTFDVVLSDIGLPDGSGYDIISQAKRKQMVTGVALTGFGTDEDIRRGREAGFDFHLIKPVDFHELRSVLDQVGV